MSQSLRTLIAAHIAVAFVSTSIAISAGRAAGSHPRSISGASTSKTTATVRGVGAPGLELVMRIGKTARNRQLEWTANLPGAFTAKVEYGRVPLEGEKVGKGIILTVQEKSSKTVFNIAIAKGGPVPLGTVRFRTGRKNGMDEPIIQADGSSVVIADIVQDDAAAVPVTILLRPQAQKVTLIRGTCGAELESPVATLAGSFSAIENIDGPLSPIAAGGLIDVTIGRGIQIDRRRRFEVRVVQIGQAVLHPHFKMQPAIDDR